MISNPLRAANDELNTVIPAAPEGSVLYFFRGGSFSESAEYFDGVGWFPNLTIATGEGAFIFVPSSTTLTFVGEVRQGAALTTDIPAGFSIRGSQVPQQAALSALAVPGAEGDIVYTFDSTAQQYGESSEYFDGIGWFPDLTIDVAESMFFSTQGARSWVRNFSVNN
jgi:hypothetical protein